MDLREVNKKLSELEERIVQREKEILEDKVLILYLQGYVAGVESSRNRD